MRHSKQRLGTRFSRRSGLGPLRGTARGPRGLAFSSRTSPSHTGRFPLSALDTGIWNVFPHAAVVVNPLEKEPEEFTGIVDNPWGVFLHSVVERAPEFTIQMINNVFDLYLSHCPLCPTSVASLARTAQG